MACQGVWLYGKAEATRLSISTSRPGHLSKATVDIVRTYYLCVVFQTPHIHLKHATSMLVQHVVHMSTVKTIIAVVLAISLIVFIGLFGRLPAFRRTPISFLHRVLTKHLPNALVKVDTVLTGRRLSRGVISTGHYLMYEKHPLVLIFFVLLQTLGEVAILPPLYPTLPLHHLLLIPPTVLLPHYFLYLTATTSAAIPLPPIIPPPPRPTHSSAHQPQTQQHNLHFHPTHTAAMHAYPYDHLLYRPGYFCSTCRHPKPPRSKHCSLCRACIQKHDHHCIWVNNCVGRANYPYFLGLLVAITWTLLYGTYLGWGDMSRNLARRWPRGWNQGNLDWGGWFDRLAWAMVQDVRVGATTLLSAMCVPLGGAFLVYHAYLLWAGMTTNEQGKWGEWKEDVADGVVFRAEVRELRAGVFGDGSPLGVWEGLPLEVEPKGVMWPPMRVRAWLKDDGGGLRESVGRWWYVRTRDGEQPVVRMPMEEARRRGVQGEVVEGEVEMEDMRWQKVRSMRTEMDNVYDLGLWGNLLEVFLHRG